jgi:hypothetical protein
MENAWTRPKDRTSNRGDQLKVTCPGCARNLIILTENATLPRHSPPGTARIGRKVLLTQCPAGGKTIAQVVARKDVL